MSESRGSLNQREQRMLGAERVPKRKHGVFGETLRRCECSGQSRDTRRSRPRKDSARASRDKATCKTFPFAPACLRFGILPNSRSHLARVVSRTFSKFQSGNFRVQILQRIRGADGGNGDLYLDDFAGGAF